jgi:hypothetical protein
MMSLDYVKDPYLKSLQDLYDSKASSDDDRAYAKERLRSLEGEKYNRENAGMGAAALGDFKTLLGRLESSKIRQQQAKDISARPNIYAGGLANMMANF